MALLDGLSILYLEDDHDTREVITLGLERHGARAGYRLGVGRASDVRDAAT
jgi:hypothetical protein